MKRLMRSRDDVVVETAALAIGVVVLAATLYPFWLCVIYAFNDGMDAQRMSLFLWPRKLTLDNFRVVFLERSLMRAFGVTVLRTAVGTVASLFFTSMVAYALSQERLIFRRFYRLMGLVTLYFSGGLIPTFLLLRALGLLDTFWVYIVPGLFGYFNAMLIGAYYRQSIPHSLVESAKLDGAYDFRIFVQIMLPLSKPVLATVALFLAVGNWNDWFTSAYFVRGKPALWTLPTILMRTLSETQGMSTIGAIKSGATGVRPDQVGSMSSITLASVRYATLLVTIFPVAVVYPFLQKYFVKGITFGAIKA
jgi:putative aldouronate transport system permease protein